MKAYPDAPRIGPVTRLRLVWNHPANRGRRLRAVLRGTAWLGYRLLASRPVTLRDPAGFRFPAYPDNPSAKRMVLYAGRPDYHEMRFMEHYLRPGDGVVDVGANVGIYTLLSAALVGPSGRVLAFEPGELARKRLETAVADNGFRQVTIRSEAVGATADRVRFLRGRGVGNRVAARGDDGHPVTDRRQVNLDAELRGSEWAFAKIDVEGAEPLVLEGAHECLAAADPPVWLIEVNGKLHDYGFDENQLEDWLAERGYDLAVYDADFRVLRFGRGLWRKRSSEPGAGNLFAVARERRNAIMKRLQGNETREGP